MPQPRYLVARVSTADRLMLVDDAIALTDGTREVKLYNVSNFHSSGMLVGYVPDARILFTADLVSDTFPVEMITCGHGNAMPYAQLADVLGK